MPAVARARPRAPPFIDPPGYIRHRPEGTLLYRLVEQHYPVFRELRAGMGRLLPEYVEQEFDAYLKCGRLEEGFLRVRCEHCHAEKLVAFSCKRRGFCPSCGARRMAETAALLADEVLPERPLRQWVLSLPHALRFLLATEPDALTMVLGVVYRITYAWTHVFHLMRFDLHDHNPERDWFTPFLSSMCGWAEHQVRNSLELPSLLDEKPFDANMKALVLSSFMNSVMSEVRYPDLDFADKLKDNELYFEALKPVYK